jgi:threonine dehydratase
MKDLASRPTGWGGPIVEAPTVAAVDAAAERIGEVVVHTPLVPFYSGKEKTGILLKPEIFQPIGSFKLRGVFNWAAALTPDERQRGLSTISSGNTAQALGYSARHFGVSARTRLLDTAPAGKIAALQGYGVDTVLVPSDDLMGYLLEARWQQEPYSFINPIDNPWMIAGNATIGREIMADYPEVESVYVPVSGGGMIAGIGGLIKALNPSVRIVGVQPTNIAPLHASIAESRPMWVDAQPTICDGCGAPLVFDEMYPVLRQVVDEVMVISEDTVKAAIKVLALKNKLIVEGAGALSVAAALATPAERRGRTVCVVSGGSIDTERLLNILTDETIEV